jgi:hypothetical protein
MGTDPDVLGLVYKSAKIAIVIVGGIDRDTRIVACCVQV